MIRKQRGGSQEAASQQKNRESHHCLCPPPLMTALPSPKYLYNCAYHMLSLRRLIACLMVWRKPLLHTRLCRSLLWLCVWCV